MRALLLGRLVARIAHLDGFHQRLAVRLLRAQSAVDLIQRRKAPLNHFFGAAKGRALGHQDARLQHVAVQLRQGLEADVAAGDVARRSQGDEKQCAQHCIARTNAGIDRPAKQMLAHPLEAAVEAGAQPVGLFRAHALDGTAQMVRQDEKGLDQADGEDHQQHDGHDPQDATDIAGEKGQRAEHAGGGDEGG